MYTEEWGDWTATAGRAHSSTTVPDRVAADVDEVVLRHADGRTGRFAVTLLWDEITTCFVTWGDRSHWLSGDEALLDELEGADYDAAITAIRWAAQTACEHAQDHRHRARYRKSTALRRLTSLWDRFAGAGITEEEREEMVNLERVCTEQGWLIR